MLIKQVPRRSALPSFLFISPGCLTAAIHPSTHPPIHPSINPSIHLSRPAALRPQVSVPDFFPMFELAVGAEHQSQIVARRRDRDSLADADCAVASGET